MNNTSHPLSAKIPAAIGILLITLVIVGAIVLTHHSLPTTSTTAKATTNSSSAAPGQSYKDGTYTETGHYNSPAGAEALAVTLMLSGSTVTDATVTSQANDPTASSYQFLFIGGYKNMVVGKKLNDINLTNVSGSSLTPKGFMDALSKIETDAKA